MENKEFIECGKVVRFPKNTKAVTALQQLEKIKVNPKKIWYLIIENQDNELKTVKYNRNNNINLLDYTNSLKNLYLQNCKDSFLIEQIEQMIVVGEADFSIIKNIPSIRFKDDQTLLSKITSDLIKLLA